MFVLRVINGEGEESNQSLGNSYNLLLKESHPDKFKSMSEVIGLDEEVYDKAYGFVVYDDGASVRPLYVDQQNYIMNDRGRTFANVTYK